MVPLHLLHLVDAAGVIQNPLAQRGLAGIDVSGNANVTEEFEFHRHT
jgi:hypothetical protein